MRALVRQKRARLSEKYLSTYRKYKKDSWCDVSVIPAGSGLQCISITFCGKAAIFPSNYYEPATRYVKKRNGRGSKLIPYVKRSESAKARLMLARDLYIETLVKQGLAIPSFHEVAVHVQVELKEHSDVRDGHNHSKAIGDWIEDVGLIENDSRAQIHCFKRADYESGDKQERELTTITIVPLEAVRGGFEQFRAYVRGFAHEGGNLGQTG